MFTTNSIVEQKRLNAYLEHKKQWHEQGITNILLDLHGVIVTFSVSKALCASARLLLENPIIILMPINPLFWHALYKAYHACPAQVPEVMFKEIAARESYLAQSYNSFLQLLNSYTIDPDAIWYIKKMHEDNFFVSLASNIGPDAWTALHKEVAPILPYLSNCYTAWWSHDKKYERKPSEAYFNACIASLKEPASVCLMVDDKYKNLLAAKKIGLHTWLFTAWK